MRIKRIPLSQSFRRLITINKKYNYQRVIIMENEKQQKEDMNIETVAAYWSHRGFVGMELRHKIMDTLNRGEIVDDDNDACKVCE